LLFRPAWPILLPQLAQHWAQRVSKSWIFATNSTRKPKI